ncbi:hypothetical protein KIL84_015834 [Mauremys mutica]|uniref:Uncharacterized protein n=1 Tax=Mauremys mutica TaxID=74926 RepID=A0A9D4AMC5_9SAUR|nr:hypothetical protein KIL84_015834 [Mauremys mutica]
MPWTQVTMPTLQCSLLKFGLPTPPLCQQQRVSVLLCHTALARSKERILAPSSIKRSYKPKANQQATHKPIKPKTSPISVFILWVWHVWAWALEPVEGDGETSDKEQGYRGRSGTGWAKRLG